VALTAAALALDLVNEPADRAAASMGWGAVTAGVGLLILACALPILARHPRHSVGWVMAGSSLLWVFDGVAESWASYGLTASPDLPLTGFAVWFVAQLGAFLLVSLPLLLVLYPDGRLLSGAWGRVSVLTIAMACSLPLLLSLAPARVFEQGERLPVDPGMPSLPLADGTYLALLTVARPLTLISLLLAVAVVFVRQRRATGLDRARLRWLVWAAVMCVIVTCSALISPNTTITMIALVCCLGVTGVSVAVGILDPEITDVDALMGGTLVYASVAAAVIGLDLALVAGLNALLGDRLDERDVTLLVLLVAVAAYGPLRVWLGALIRRVLVGRRGDRYDVVAGLAAQLEASNDVREQLPALATAVATAFKLDYVRVEVFGHAGGTLAATHGAEPAATREVSIHYGGEDVGRLVLPARGVRSMLSRRDQTLLFDVVRQAAIAVRSSRLAAELQQSREQLVLAREEDRRRIRRDLHDGLGPVLGGVALRLDAVANAMESDPASARRMIGQSRQDVTDALADVRRLVHGLRPPALDDLGLVDALRQQVERIRPSRLGIELEAVGLPSLPAAVEVAAYRIASEALANTVRHAQASAARLRLVGGPGELVVEVSDDGVGIAPDRTAGVGLRSIRERAEELGGRAEITCPPGDGTRVRAWLPVSTQGQSNQSEEER
jgi:two-component system, NarL family, sensor kinase